MKGDEVLNWLKLIYQCFHLFMLIMYTLIYNTLHSNND